MRLTITTKIALGLAIVVLLGVSAMAFIGAGLRSVGRSLGELTDDTAPRSAAVYEMEINVNGFGLAVLNYRHRVSPRFRAWARDDEIDFERFHALFMTLVDSPEEWRLGEEIGKRFREYRKAGNVLMSGRDRQEQLFREMDARFEAMDTLIDREIQPALLGRGPRGVRALVALLDVEADLAELGHSLASYRQHRDASHRGEVRRQEQELAATLARFRALPAPASTAAACAELARHVDETMGLVRSAAAIESGLQRRSLALIALRDEIDRVIDSELELLLTASLSRPQREAARATRRVTRTLWILIPLFVAAAVIVGLVLRAILQPLAALMRETRRVGRGDLAHRLDVRGNDELADLGRAFNTMVAELEATTVSKTRLEESERTLARTVDALRHEIAERQRASEERVRLEASLRRSEVMSAMGVLVAGVAHEVRNPLFGISSVVDALEARLAHGSREPEIAPHLTLLRGEVDRLSRLMRDLLELGRPSTDDLVDGPVADVVREALAICAPLAARAEVAIDADLGDVSVVVAMHRERLLQVFRNVIENAIQHSPRGGRVTVRASVPRGEGEPVVECVVADAGGGIAADDVPRLFEPFFSRRRGGTGLGLSIVQRIVEEHGGTVSAANRAAGGAEFVIRLPIAASTPAEARRAAS
jgi:signal transduction histidine kinase